MTGFIGSAEPRIAPIDWVWMTPLVSGAGSGLACGSTFAAGGGRAAAAAANSDGLAGAIERVVGIGAFPTLLGGPRLELAASLRTGGPAIAAAGEVLARIGKSPSVVQDRVGLVMPRILCMVMNEAFFALTEQVASPADIDTAMKLGTNYPRGPLEWANLIGVGQVVAVLDALRAATGEERYRVAPLLYQMSLETGPWKK